MTTQRQHAAARSNMKKATAAAKRKRTLTKLSSKTRSASGKQANRVKQEKSGGR